MAKVGVLGGSFDPVHLGHIALAEAALAEAGLDLLMIMPAKVQPFKQDMNVTCERHREAMVRLAFGCGDQEGEGWSGAEKHPGQEQKIQISRYELDSRENPSYTILTLEHIREEYPKAEIFFVCGTDSYLSLEEWYRGTEILKNYSLVVSARPGYKEALLKENRKLYKERYGTETVMLHSEMPDISSTEVRERIRSGQSVSKMIPAPIERYIKGNGLYK